MALLASYASVRGGTCQAEYVKLGQQNSEDSNMFFLDVIVLVWIVYDFMHR